MASKHNQEEIDLSTLILCSYCKNVYTDPVILPCNRNICRFHIQEYLKNNSGQMSYLCNFCEKYHKFEKNGSFPLNNQIDNLVKKMQFLVTEDSHSRNETHKAANDSYNKLKNMFEEFTSINDESELHIYNYFSELERQIDNKREVLIQEIHKISDKLRIEISVKKKEIQAEYERKQENVKGLLEDYQKKSDSYNKELKDHSNDLNKLKVVQKEIDKISKELEIRLANLKDELLCNPLIDFKEGNTKIDSNGLFGEILIDESKKKEKLNDELDELNKESEKLAKNLYHVTSYRECNTVGEYVEKGYKISRLKNFFNNVYSEKLIEKLIENSSEEKLPTGLRTKTLRHKNKERLLKMIYYHRCGDHNRCDNHKHAYDNNYHRCGAYVILESNNPNSPKDLMMPVGYILFFEYPESKPIENT